MFPCELHKIFRSTSFLEHLQTTAPTFNKIFMTANFSCCNYDIVNTKKFLISYIELPLPISFYIFLSYLVNCMYLSAPIDLYFFV